MATATPPRLDDERIEHPLRRVRKYIRLYVALEGLALVGVFLALWFWVGVLFDYGTFRLTGIDWVQDVPWGARAVVSGVVALALLVVLVRTVFGRLFRDFRDDAVALILEKRFPDRLGDRLITAVELADAESAKRYGFSAEMIRNTVDQARGRVDQLPVAKAFNWGRLARRGLWLLVVTVGLAGLAVGGIALVCGVTGRSTPVAVGDGQDVASIWAERNLLLRDVPWPRRAYLQIVDFEGRERRLNQAEPSTRVRVVAWRYVVADRSTRDGWRQARFGELRPAWNGGDAIPELPLAALADKAKSAEAADERFKVGQALLAAGGPVLTAVGTVAERDDSDNFDLPADLPLDKDSANAWPADRWYDAVIGDQRVFAYLKRRVPGQMSELEDLFSRLDESGRRSENSRAFRRVVVPEEVTLEYWGEESRNKLTLEVRGGEYEGLLAGLTESVKLEASAENYTTPTHEVILVPPPAVQKLTVTEEVPAYLYHMPPVGQDMAWLKGRRQKLRPRDASPGTDLAVVLSVPAGTDMAFSGTADKDLRAVRVFPKPGKFPGVPPDAAVEPIAADFDPEEPRAFGFKLDGDLRVTGETEFDLELTDAGGVRSRLAVSIRAEPDEPPRVKAAVKWLRPIEGGHLCTPAALAAFAQKLSRATDSQGLRRVDVEAVISPEPPAGRAELIGMFGGAGVAAARPAPPSETIVVVLQDADQLKGDEGVNLPTGEVEEKLKQPQPPDRPRLTKQAYGFTDEDDSEVAIDLQAEAAGRMATLAERAMFPTTGRFDVTLTVRAADGNVEAADGGQVGKASTPIRLKVVAERELLRVIGDEETALGQQLVSADESLKEGQSRLRQLIGDLSRLRGVVERAGSPDPDVRKKAQTELSAAGTRAATVQETLASTYGICVDLAAAYRRIKNEYVYNRCQQAYIDKAQTIDKSMGELMALFPQTVRLMDRFSDPLQRAGVPGDGLASDLSDSYQELIDKMTEVRRNVVSAGNLRTQIRRLRELLERLGIAKKDIERLLKEKEEEVNLTWVTAPPLQLKAGQSGKVTLKVKVGLEVLEGFKLKLAPLADSGLEYPKELSVKLPEEFEAPAEVSLTVKAGKKKGTFRIKLTPQVDKGRPGELVVTVE